MNVILSCSTTKLVNRWDQPLIVEHWENFCLTCSLMTVYSLVKFESKKWRK